MADPVDDFAVTPTEYYPEVATSEPTPTTTTTSITQETTSVEQNHNPDDLIDSGDELVNKSSVTPTSGISVTATGSASHTQITGSPGDPTISSKVPTTSSSPTGNSNATTSENSSLSTVEGSHDSPNLEAVRNSQTFSPDSWTWSQPLGDDQQPGKT